LEPDGLSDDVRALLERIASISELETLLLLHRTAPAEWSAERLAGELRIERGGAEQHLAALAARELLALRQAEGAEHYRYAPGSEELDRAVDALASSYEKRRVSVVQTLYSKPTDSVRVFADAFRLRMDRSDG
jgi:predicted ArsR family transcriptional regulator